MLEEMQDPKGLVVPERIIDDARIQQELADINKVKTKERPEHPAFAELSNVLDAFPYVEQFSILEDLVEHVIEVRLKVRKLPKVKHNS